MDKAKNYILTLIGVLLVIGAIVVSVVAYQSVSQVVSRVQTHHDLKSILLALHEYHDEHGHFPPAKVVDENGNMRSWRSLINGANYGYDQSQPWDSDGNRPAIQKNSYASRLQGQGYLCLAIVGETAAWLPSGTRKMRDFTDGSHNTLLLLAIRDTEIEWWEPRDLLLDGTNLTIEGDPSRPVNLKNAYLCRADGTINMAEQPISMEVLRKMLTVDGGEPLE